jgi:hypothetical protein
VKIGRGVRQGRSFLPILFNLYSEYFSKEALEGFGGFKRGGKLIRTTEYVDDLFLLDQEGKALQGMAVRPNEIGRCYGMEINVKNPKLKLKATILSTDRNRLKTTTVCRTFQLFGQQVTNAARFTREIKSRIATVKPASTRVRHFSPANWT